MALLLNIDTAIEQAGVCLSKNGQILALQQTHEQKNHASFIQPAIKQVMEDGGYQLHDIDAVAVSSGPGSYTGLRVGLATAKGLCYALQKPLIMLNTLEIMAWASIQETKKNQLELPANHLFCPMIDARRMEIFTALYNAQLEVIMPPAALVLDENCFGVQLEIAPVLFSGSGSTKAQIIKHHNAFFGEATYFFGEMVLLAEKAYSTSNFADLAYSEPFYLKEFYKPIKKN